MKKDYDLHKEAMAAAFVLGVLIVLFLCLVAQSVIRQVRRDAENKARFMTEDAIEAQNRAFSEAVDKYEGILSVVELSPEKRAFYAAVSAYYTIDNGVLRARRRNERVAVYTEPTTEEAESEEASVEWAVIPELDPWGQPLDTDYRTTLYADYKIPEEIYTELVERLRANGIEWFLPYAVAQIFQESRFDPNAENPNGLDKGLLQYRLPYWSALCVAHQLPADTDIFDWRAQIYIYCFDMAHRLNHGIEYWEAISRHKTSDYGQYDETYFYQVMRWVRIPNSNDGM